MSVMTGVNSSKSLHIHGSIEITGDGRFFKVNYTLPQQNFLKIKISGILHHLAQIYLAPPAILTATTRTVKIASVGKTADHVRIIELQPTLINNLKIIHFTLRDEKNDSNFYDVPLQQCFQISKANKSFFSSEDSKIVILKPPSRLPQFSTKALNVSTIKMIARKFAAHAVYINAPSTPQLACRYSFNTFEITHYDPYYSRICFGLALTIPTGHSIRLQNGATKTPQMLFIETLRYDPNFVYAYNHLALTLSHNATIQVFDGIFLTRQQLFIKSIHLNPNQFLPYFHLAVALPPNGSIQLLDGTTMSQQQLFIKIIHLNPNSFSAYYCLAIILPQGGSVQLLDGRTMSQLQLLVHALHLNTYHAPTYHHLALILPPTATIQLNGLTLTKNQLFIAANQLDSRFPLPQTPPQAHLFASSSVC